MRSVTYADLVSRILSRYDLPTATANTFVSTTVISQFVNAALQRYYGLLIEHRAEEYYTWEETFTATASSASYATSSLTLASLIDVRALQWVRGANDLVDIKLGNVDDFYKRSLTARAWDDCAKYALIRNQIYWLPVPSSSYTVRIWYTGVPADISGTTAFDGGPKSRCNAAYRGATANGKLREGAP